MKNIAVVIFIIFYSISLHAQYYYQDIVGTKELNQMIQLYLKNKVRTVQAAGFNGEGVQDSDFAETHQFFPNLDLLKISSRNRTDISNEFYRFNAKGLLVTITDSASSLVSKTSYDYDDRGNPVSIANVVNDANDSVYESEVHQWLYNADGKPVRMLRIVNTTDTTDVRFTLDSKGNVIEELPFVRKVSREKIYYYYDDKNRLTDIVRFNTKAGRLLPDYMFEYSVNNEVAQKITTLSAAGTGYLIWRYAYDDRGLKTTEASFNRNKELTGKIKYNYQFGQ
jgi:hypothetical protein